MGEQAIRYHLEKVFRETPIYIKLMSRWRNEGKVQLLFGKKIVFEVGESHAAVDYVHSLSEMRRANKQVGVGQMLGMRSWEGRVPTTSHQGQ